MSQPPSQQDSIDLSYDMWAGQFEFIGTNNSNLNSSSSASDKNSSRNRSTDSLEDLNLNFNTTTSGPTRGDLFNNQPILIDQETFLSLHAADFEDDPSLAPSGPNSMVFIENKLNSLNAIDSNSNRIINAHNIEAALSNKFNFKSNNSNNNNNTNGFKLENLRNFKNKLISDFSTISDKPIPPYSHQQSSAKMNGISAEICDNLNEQLELLKRQVTDLADSQNNVDDRTTRTKTEYAVLQTKYLLLEEQYRESELRAEERLADEQKRHRELLTRVEREAALQNENCQIKIQSIEVEVNALREEAQRLRTLCDRQASDLHTTEEKLEMARESIAVLQQTVIDAKERERKFLEEKKASEEVVMELGRELERLRAENETSGAYHATSDSDSGFEELHRELQEMRQRNKDLEEQNEELQAVVLTRGVEEGRSLLNDIESVNSLAQELGEMSHAQDTVDSAKISQLHQALQEKEDENQRLKNYIDTILLNIVENYPQLLEVKAIQSQQ